MERPDVSHQIVAVDFLTPDMQRQKLVWLAKELASGRLRPLPHVTHSMKNAVSALRQMSQARHVGKIVAQAAMPSSMVSHFHKGTVAVTGGMGMLGSLVATWFHENGWHHLKLVGRSGKATGTADNLNGMETFSFFIFVQNQEQRSNWTCFSFFLCRNGGISFAQFGGILSFHHTRPKRCCNK